MACKGDLPEGGRACGDTPSQGRGQYLGAMIRSWTKEDDAGEQRETLQHLVRSLDEDRFSNRKLFPEELKGKSW